MGNQRSLLSGWQFESLVRIVDDTTQSIAVLSPKQSPGELGSCWPPRHMYYPLPETVTQSQNRIISNPTYKTVPAFAETISTIYQYLINVNSATGTTWKGQILHPCYFKYKIGFGTAGPIGENLQDCLISPAKDLLQELEPLWWRGWWAGSVTLSQSSLSHASWVPCLWKNMMRSFRTPGAWWI